MTKKVRNESDGQHDCRRERKGAQSAETAVEGGEREVADDGDGKHQRKEDQAFFQEGFGERTFSDEESEIERRGDDKTERHSHGIGVYADILRQKQHRAQHQRRADEVVGKGDFFKVQRVEYARRNHREAHGQQHQTAVADHLAGVRVRVQHPPYVLAQNEEERNERAGDEDGGGQPAFDIGGKLAIAFPVKVFGELGNEHEGNGADDGGGNGEHGHRHAGHHAEHLQGFRGAGARPDEHGGQQDGHRRADQRAACAHCRNGQG